MKRKKSRKRIFPPDIITGAVRGIADAFVAEQFALAGARSLALASLLDSGRPITWDAINAGVDRIVVEMKSMMIAAAEDRKAAAKKGADEKAEDGGCDEAG